MTDTSDDWREAIAQAQLEPMVRGVDGKLYARVRYGKDYPGLLEPDEYREQCHDCDVQLGQLHVPGCDVERCPDGGQLISCCCDAELEWAGPHCGGTAISPSPASSPHPQRCPRSCGRHHLMGDKADKYETLRRLRFGDLLRLFRHRCMLLLMMTPGAATFGFSLPTAR